IGPFGVCYTIQRQRTHSPSTNCAPLTSPSAVPDDVPDNLPAWLALGGQVDPKVDHVDFAMTTGTCRAKVVRIGDHAFAVCFTGPGFGIVRRTLFDASGKVIADIPTPTKP